MKIIVTSIGGIAIYIRVKTVERLDLVWIDIVLYPMNII
jgi:hypothetical protein